MAAARVIAPKTSHSASAPPTAGELRHTSWLMLIGNERTRRPLAGAQPESLSGGLRRGPEVPLLLLIRGAADARAWCSGPRAVTKRQSVGCRVSTAVVLVGLSRVVQNF